jgi:undecaprenyl-diphosphatase
MGAILCLPIFFRRRIESFLVTFPRGTHGDRTVLTHPLTLTAIAFVCTAGPSFLLRKVIGKNLENLALMGSALVAGGIVMWVVDAMYGAHRGGSFAGSAAEELEAMGLAKAVWIGGCQILSAVFPGTSRSMVTIAAGQISGFSRTAALEFSFLLSIPTMIAATGYDLLKFLQPGRGEAALTPPHIDPHGWVLLAIGFLVSFASAYAVVAWFMQWVRNRGFVPFAIYRLVAGVVVLAWAFNIAR